MANKSKKINIALVSILALTFFAFAGMGQAKASGDLGVQFSGQPGPMFNASNFLPGDSASGWAKVSNASSSSKKIVVWTTNANNPKNDKKVRLGDVLKISIAKEGNATPFYNETVTDFFKADYVTLDNLAGNGSGTYNFTVSFDLLTGNDYQKTGVSFDLNIGSWQEYMNESPSGVTYFTTGGSAPLFDFQITNVKDENTSETGSSISWDTNAEATTQIIFSRQDQPHLLTNNPPYYGYANVYPLPEDANFTYHHQVFLNGLTPCSTYYYRVVSHRLGMPDTVSQPEESFVTICPQQHEQEQGLDNNQGSGLLARNQINPRVSGASIGDGSSEGSDQNGQPQLEQVGEQDQANAKKTNFNLMANLASIWDGLSLGVCWPNFPWWLFLLFAAYPILKGLDYWNGRRSRSISFFAISLIPIIIAIWAYINRYVCLPWWLLIVLFIASIIIWLADRKFSKTKKV